MPKKQATPKPQAPALDPAFIEKVRPAIEGTWGVIAADVYASIESVSGKRAKPLKNSEALETALDANYIGTNGWPQEEALIDAAIELYGYPKVLAFFNKQIRLV